MSKSRPVHPLAAKMPAMSVDEYQGLVASIDSEGLLEPIVLDPEGFVIDGRHRERACLELGVAPRYCTREFTDVQDKAAFVWAMNANRRHLEPGRRAALWLTCFEDLDALRARAAKRSGRPKKGVSVDPLGKTREVIAKKLQVANGTAAKAMAVADRDPDLLAKVAEPGGPSLESAYKQVRRAALQEGTAGKLAVFEANAAEHRTTPPWVVWSLLGSGVSRTHFGAALNALDPFAGHGEIPEAVATVLPSYRWSLHELRRSCHGPLEGLGLLSHHVLIGDFFEANPHALRSCEIAIFNPPFSLSEQAVKHLFEHAPHADIWMLQRRNWIDQARASWLREHMPDEFVLPRRIKFGQAATGVPYKGTDSCSHCWYFWPHRGRTRRVGEIAILDLIESAEECLARR